MHKTTFLWNSALQILLVSWRSGAPCAHALVCHSVCVGHVHISAVIRSTELLTALSLFTLLAQCWIQPACCQTYYFGLVSFSAMALSAPLLRCSTSVWQCIGLVIPMHCHTLIEHLRRGADKRHGRERNVIPRPQPQQTTRIQQGGDQWHKPTRRPT